MAILFFLPTVSKALYLDENGCRLTTAILPDKELPAENTFTCGCSGMTFTSSFLDGEIIPAGTLTGNISIEGTVTINGAVIFNGSTTFISQGGKIVVNSTGSITAKSGAIFSGCTALEKWNGIQILGGKVDFNDVVVKDAVNALNFFPASGNYSASKIIAVKFKDNFCGILIGNPDALTGGAAMSFNLGVNFKQNEFTSSNTTKPFRYGIRAFNCAPCSIGNSPVSNNTFTKVWTGIFASNSQLTVYGANFTEMKKIDPTPFLSMLEETGWGIFTDKSKLTTFRCKFTRDGVGGIFCNALMIGLSVTYCEFTTETSFGLRTANSAKPAFVQVYHNTFTLDNEQELAAISISRPPNAAGTLKNYIDLNTNGS